MSDLTIEELASQLPAPPTFQPPPPPVPPTSPPPQGYTTQLDRSPTKKGGRIVKVCCHSCPQPVYFFLPMHSQTFLFFFCPPCQFFPDCLVLVVPSPLPPNTRLDHRDGWTILEVSSHWIVVVQNYHVTCKKPPGPKPNWPTNTSTRINLDKAENINWPHKTTIPTWWNNIVNWSINATNSN